MKIEMICKKIFILSFCLSFCVELINAQVFVTDYKTEKVEKDLFSNYTTTFNSYYNEDGIFYIENFAINIEFPETEILTNDVKQQINTKIANILEAGVFSTPYELENQCITKYFLSKYNQELVRGDEACNKFLDQIRSTNEDASSDLFWEPSFYGKITGELIFQTNSFISYRLIVENCNAMSCLRKETCFVYDLVNQRFVKENEFLPAQNLEAFTTLLQNSVTKEQKLTYNSGQMTCTGNFFLDEFGITYVMNTNRYVSDEDPSHYVCLSPKQFRTMLKQESIVYKFFNIGQVERAKAQKQNKAIVK